MFYDNLMTLCEEAGVAPSTLLVNLEIGKAGLKRWREGGEPSNPIKKKIADYFGITVAQLMAGEVTETKKPAINEDDELNRYLDELRNRSEMRMLFSVSEGCTKEEVEQAVRIIEAIRKKEN